MKTRTKAFMLGVACALICAACTTKAYIMHEERKLGIPSEYYVRACLDGYKAFGFDKNVLMEALEYSTRRSA